MKHAGLLSRTTRCLKPFILRNSLHAAHCPALLLAEGARADVCALVSNLRRVVRATGLDAPHPSSALLNDDCSGWRVVKDV
jgi:hypothetical protein